MVILAAVVGLLTLSSPDVKVNQFMSYNPSTKTVNITAYAAFNSVQGGFNFNGGSNGSQTITVPAGWTVNIDVINKDAIPHSAIIIANQMPLPNAPSTPAIERAYTSHLIDGLQPQNGEDTINITAPSSPGKYLFACGVPGHATSGMWIYFAVAAQPAPTYAGV
jgi:sulfocyanin